MISPSITNDAVFTALRAFLLSFVDCEVRQAEINNVPMPQGSFVTMQDIGKNRLSTNLHGYADGSETIATPTEMTIQVDFYGEDAPDMCQTFLTLFNDSRAYDQFPAVIKPLYADNSREIALISGEENYVFRWTTEAHLQINPTVKLPIDTIESIPVNTILANGAIQ